MASLGIRFGVIQDARRRQRRRRLATAVLVIAALVMIAALRGGQPESPAPVKETAVSARAALASRPGMGVACPTPNSITCDRVGVIVALRRPAVSVRAELSGHSALLNDPNWSPPARKGHRKGFAGFIQPAGLRDLIPASARPHDRWIGAGEPAAPPLLTLHIDYGHGRRTVVRTHAFLSPGWG